MSPGLLSAVSSRKRCSRLSLSRQISATPTPASSSVRLIAISRSSLMSATSRSSALYSSLYPTPVTNAMPESTPRARSSSSVRSSTEWRPDGDQLVDRPPRDQAARLHDGDVVGHLLHLVEDVRRDEDGALLLLDEVADHRAELEHAGGIEAVGRLVEHEQLGVVEQGARHAEALAHAERVGLDLVARALAQLDALEHRRDARARLAAVVRGPDVEIAAAAEVRIEARLLDDPADARERLADVAAAPRSRAGGCVPRSAARGRASCGSASSCRSRSGRARRSSGRAGRRP